ncbi:MAG: hypothetical protein JW776_01375 [Candidatus Lokiarchaeota archaeon]|nr:hypothetical protein [Candidatus Lokiarchaeota archaeon]
MKAWIVHDSKFGNGKSLGEAMMRVLSEKMEVEIGHVKSTSPRRVARDKPDLLIVGTAVRMFSTSFASKSWIRRLKRQLRKEHYVIPLGAVFLTHIMKKARVHFWGRRFHKILDRGIAISEVYPEWLSGRVKEAEGPLYEGTIENFTHIAHQILKNTSKST